MSSDKLENASEKKLHFCAQAVKLFIDANVADDNDRKRFFSRMIVEGIRKAHDQSESKLGKGKFLGHPHWSDKAYRLLSEEGSLTLRLKQRLRHEHAVPLIYLVNNILFLMPRGTTTREIFDVLVRLGKVAIITREEDAELTKMLAKKMPDGWDDSHDPFARYRAAGIEVIERDSLPISQSD